VRVGGLCADGGDGEAADGEGGQAD